MRDYNGQTRNDSYVNNANILSKTMNWNSSLPQTQQQPAFMIVGQQNPYTSFAGTGGGRRRGKCKWFNVAKGWGFVTPDDGTQDVFVHQSVVHKCGFRSLADGEEVEFECKPSELGIEATMVCGPGGSECRGSDRRPLSRKKFRRIRCYNCGDLGTHIAAKCPHGPLPKRCHNCKAVDHLIADCPLKDPTTSKRRNDNNGGPGPSMGNGHGGNHGGGNMFVSV